MRMGIDLDNTIVCYNGLFHRVAVRERLIPAECPGDKQAVRDFLRAAGRNDDWTRLQGQIYGEAMPEASPFPGASEFFQAAKQAGSWIAIVSHRSRFPYLGPPIDLHQAALHWLRQTGFTAPDSGGATSPPVYLEETLEGKLRRIAELRLDVFVDDLPELLLHEAFPLDTRRICFDPANRCHDQRLERVGSWSELMARCLENDRPATERSAKDRSA